MKSMMFIKIRKRIHGFFFPGYATAMKNMIDEATKYRLKYNDSSMEIVRLEKQIKETIDSVPEEMENLMRRSLGLPYINFHDIEPDGKGNDNPPHYLKGLDDQARKAYVAELAQIYKNDKFQAVVNYHINVLGNFSLQKAKDEDMRSGRIGIIALRGFRKEFEDANAEYQDTLKPEEEFDTHGILPE